MATLCLVVGARGCGRQTLLNGARGVLANNPQYAFPMNRTTAPPAAPGSSSAGWFEHTSEKDFNAQRENGSVFLASWKEDSLVPSAASSATAPTAADSKSNTLANSGGGAAAAAAGAAAATGSTAAGSVVSAWFGIVKSTVMTELSAGRRVVVAVSHTAISDIERAVSLQFPVKVIHITLPKAVLIARVKAMRENGSNAAAAASDGAGGATQPPPSASGSKPTTLSAAAAGDKKSGRGSSAGGGRGGAAAAGTTAAAAGSGGGVTDSKDGGGAATASATASGGDSKSAGAAAGSVGSKKSGGAVSGAPLSKKEREKAEAARLAALAAEPTPLEGVRATNLIELVNDRTIDAGCHAFLIAIGWEAGLSDPVPPPPQPHTALHPDVDLKTCGAAEYLRVAVFPALNSALTLLDRIRPNDPVDWLAVHLYQQASTVRTGMALVAEKRHQQQLAENAHKKDLTVPARI